MVKVLKIEHKYATPVKKKKKKVVKRRQRTPELRPLFDPPMKQEESSP